MHTIVTKSAGILILVASLIVAFALGPVMAQAGDRTEPVQEYEKKEKQVVTETKVKSDSSAVSVADLIELLIRLGVIPADKAGEARSFVKTTTTTVKEKTECPSSPFEYNLYLDVSDKTTNGEVTRLQKWLASMSDIYPEGLITGHFGPATEQAVQRYQTKKGIVSSGAPETTGYGVVGPKTRRVMNACWDTGEVEKKKEEQVSEKKKESEEVDTSKEVTDIELHADEANGKVWWEVDGYANQGFKVVWSKDENPTYPTRNDDKYSYLTSPDSRHARLEAFDGKGTYYVRVCEYVDGECELYSNEVSLDLE
jgi:hypothetical protein